MSGNQDALQRIFNDQLGWAFRAYDRFLSTLSEEVRSHLAFADQAEAPYVVVFGKTQVGKTTLLLDLMGVKVDQQARVNQVMRGRREHGKSATATAMEYRRSQDECWHLATGDGKRTFATDNGMCEALGALREAMSERRLNAEQPAVVWIPRDCFGDGASEDGPRMLDLPGDNPVDEIEREHVELMAQRYVPHADLILLVGRADDLSFLNPEALTLPAIDDWQFVPNRFRIVTTYSFTPDTVQQFALNCKEPLTAEHFRRRLLEQIGTFGLPLSMETQQTWRYFPLEFGKSWQAMRSLDTDLVRVLDPIVTALKDELQKDINASATRAARVRNAMDVHIVAARKRAIRVKAGEEALAELGYLIDKIKADWRSAIDGERTATERKVNASALLMTLPRVKEVLGSRLTFDVTKYIDKVDDDKKLATNTGALLGLINQVKSWLGEALLTTIPDESARKFLGNERPDLKRLAMEADRIIDDEFSTLVSRMASYWSKEYYPNVSKSFSEDRSRLRLDIRDAADKVSRLAKNAWETVLIRRATALQADCLEADRVADTMRHIATDLAEETCRLAERQRRASESMASDVTRLDEDARTGSRFVAMLDEEYLNELQQRRQQIVSTDSPPEALLALLSTAVLRDERSSINLSRSE